MVNIYYSKYTDSNVLYEHRLLNEDVEGYPLHNHPMCEMLFVKKGNITYMIEGKSYNIKKNTLIFTRPSKGHSIIFNDTSDYERYLVLFDDKALFNGLYKKISKDFDVIDFENYPFVTTLFEKFEGSKADWALDAICEQFR